jgi:FlaA1/EpsC-like NDP-sugar epimerase
MLLEFLKSRQRRTKVAAYFLTDLLLVPACLYAAHALRYGTALPGKILEGEGALFTMMTLAGAAVILCLRLPWIKLSALEGRAAARIGFAAGVLSVSAMVFSYIFGLTGPRSVPMIFGALFFVAALGARYSLLVLITFVEERGGLRRPVIIYGAGSAGLRMARSLRGTDNLRPVAFVDDNTSLHGVIMAGLPVLQPSKLESLKQRWENPLILLAMPSIDKARQQAIARQLAARGLEVQVTPAYEELLSQRGNQTELRTVSPDAILGRDKVDLDTPEIARAYAGRTVMVTGAGGSIGSELCRQLMDCRPSRIILFEQSEFALYEIDQSLRARSLETGIAVISRLGSVADKTRVEAVLREDKVEIVLHAAAYKHVPIVEENELEGARNNVLGTQILAEAAMAAGVERFILVSTDKAVRPANIMGATKRMAELVIQDLATRSPKTRFAMVRFGNVLGSSGSVLPLFQRQIAAGGPVTVTHPEVTRFFMTIPEAARLVLLAGAFAEGGDVFLLDMGKPRKIIDIAHQMIALSGRTVRDPSTGEGDIEIRVTGLRPGEKLYEELLIDSDSLRQTPHPKILRAEEHQLSQFEVVGMLREIRAAIQAGSSEALRRVIVDRVQEYRRPDSVAPTTPESAPVTVTIGR